MASGLGALAGGAAAGPIGWGALAGGALSSFLPMLLGGGVNRQQNQYRDQIMKLLSSQNLGQQTGNLYNQFLQSPAYAQAQRGAIQGGNQMQTSLNRALGNRGLATSGIGAIAPSLAGAAAGNMQNQIRTGAYNQAGNQAQDLIRQQVQALQGLGPPIHAGSELAGAGLSSFTPMLMQFLNQYGGRGGLPYAKPHAANDPGAGGIYG